MNNPNIVDIVKQVKDNVYQVLQPLRIGVNITAAKDDLLSQSGYETLMIFYHMNEVYLK